MPSLNSADRPEPTPRAQSATGSASDVQRATGSASAGAQGATGSASAGALPALQDGPSPQHAPHTGRASGTHAPHTGKASGTQAHDTGKASGTREELSPASRREFLRLMGASLGLAGFAGCIRWPEEQLAPYAHRPENRMPGMPVVYATAMELGGVAQGLLVTSYDGRPIKIEGNPSHPLNRGAADAIAQASVLELYDPDRSRGVIRREGGAEKAVDWDELVKAFKKLLKPRRQLDSAS